MGPCVFCSSPPMMLIAWLEMFPALGSADIGADLTDGGTAAPEPALIEAKRFCLSHDFLVFLVPAQEQQLETTTTTNYTTTNSIVLIYDTH